MEVSAEGGFHPTVHKPMAKELGLKGVSRFAGFNLRESGQTEANFPSAREDRNEQQRNAAEKGKEK